MNSVRISKACEWIDMKDFLADVGCDHGYLAIEALKKGVSFVECIDNKQEPLDMAISNISLTPYFNLVKFSCSSGLLDLDDSINCVAILGMGGHLISQILEEGKHKIKPEMKFILGANTKVSILRHYLSTHGFKIEDEAIVFEKGKFYELIRATKNKDSVALSRVEESMGPILIKKKDPLFIKKWQKEIDKNNKIIGSCPAREEELRKLNKEIEEKL